MATSFSLKDISLWPSLGQSVAELARHETLTRETMGAGVYARSLDRMGGLESSGSPSIDQRLYGGIVAGNFLDTLNAGTVAPRDIITQSYDAQRGLLTMHTGNGLLLDRLA